MVQRSAANMLEEAKTQSSRARDITPDTSISQRIGGKHLKSQGKGIGFLNYISKWRCRSQISV